MFTSQGEHWNTGIRILIHEYMWCNCGRMTGQTGFGLEYDYYAKNQQTSTKRNHINHNGNSFATCYVFYPFDVSINIYAISLLYL